MDKRAIEVKKNQFDLIVHTDKAADVSFGMQES